MNDELDPEILSYREFRNRQTLLDWQRRRRAFEAQRGRRSERSMMGAHVQQQNDRNRHTEKPQ
ncbi:MAG TPA: hypothetical protein VMT66_01120 [Steroidobacteraceae bacterium]|nr:hypothetical protein [Steroidobacteraceae bacterium]